MISHHHKVAESQVIFDELDGCYYSQELLVRGAVLPLTHIECFRGVCHRAFDYTPIILLLLLHQATHSLIASLSTQDKLSVPSQICQHRLS